MLKKCKTCGEVKEAIKGLWVIKHDRPDGLRCLACHNIAQNARRATKEAKAKLKEIRAAYSATPEGKAKIKLANAKAYATPEGRAKRIAASMASYYANPALKAAGRERARLYYANPENRAKHNAAGLLWARKNPDKACANTMKRKAAKRNRTPGWASLTKIAEFYALANELTKTTGIKHVVDHIIPLQGTHVSGLHVENNLQVITALANASKGNKFCIGE